MLLPIADSGEGTVDALARAAEGKKAAAVAAGPLGDVVEAGHGPKKGAALDMARQLAASLNHLAELVKEQM